MALHLSANKSQGGGKLLSAPRYKVPTLTSLLVLPSPAPWSWHGFLSAPQKNLGSCTPLDICTHCSLVWNILPTDTRMAHSYPFRTFPRSNLITSRDSLWKPCEISTLYLLRTRHLPNVALVFLGSESFLSFKLSYTLFLFHFSCLFSLSTSILHQHVGPTRSGIFVLFLVGVSQVPKIEPSTQYALNKEWFNVCSPPLSLLAGGYISSHCSVSLTAPRTWRLWHGADCSHRLPSYRTSLLHHIPSRLDQVSQLTKCGD